MLYPLPSSNESAFMQLAINKKTNKNALAKDEIQHIKED